MKNIIINKNLLVAERLLEITIKKPHLVHNNNSITLEKGDIFEISTEKIIEALKRLENRKIVRFDDEEDKWDIDRFEYINLYFEKNKLIKFIETAKDRLYKIPKKYRKKKELNYIIEALASILRFKFSKQPVDFLELGNKYIDVFLWIADYSGALKIIYEDKPDIKWKNLKRAQVIGISEVPKKFIIIDIPTIERLEDEIRQLVILPQRERIKLFLKNNNAIDWKCANCGHWLKTKFKEEKQIANYLNDFLINKFKICWTCRKRNYFSINQKGEINIRLWAIFNIKSGFLS